MTAFQGLKTVAVLGVLAGLAACGQAEKTADKADAPAEATQAAAETAPATGGAPTIANGFLLPAIVAVLVGGTPLTGGVGGVLNTLIGTLIVAVIRASMLYLGVEATQQQMLFGLVLIGAIALTIDRSKLRTVK